MTATDVRLGACLCGAVALEAQGAPENVGACYCASCRRHTGSPVAVYADYRVECVRFLGVEPATYASSKGVRRRFCAACGSTVSYQGDNLPTMIHLHIGLFADIQAFRPLAEDHAEGRAPWLHLTIDHHGPSA